MDGKYWGECWLWLVFAVNIDGSGFTNLHSFIAILLLIIFLYNSDGVLRLPGRFYRAIPYMDGAVCGASDKALCSPSTPMARDHEPALVSTAATSESV